MNESLRLRKRKGQGRTMAMGSDKGIRINKTLRKVLCQAAQKSVKCKETLQK